MGGGRVEVKDRTTAMFSILVLAALVISLL